MGRIKTKLVKRTALKLFQIHPDSFKKDFSENKQVVESFAEIYSKKLRNGIAGYITRIAKRQKA